MKILYLTDQTYLHGGIEKVLSQKANYLADILLDDVTIVTYNQQQHHHCYHLSDKIHFIDLDINYEVEKSYFHPKNLKKIPTHISVLKKIVKEINPDVIISSSFGPDFYFLPHIEKYIPKIKEFHSSRFFYDQSITTIKKKILHKLNATTERKYHHLVVLNESESHFYNNSNITIIPNPSEISSKIADYTSKKIMAAGRISPVKNFGDLIEVFFRINKSFPNWEIHFFGEDYVGTQSKLEEKIKEYGLQNQVKFMGICPNLKREMQNYSIYAMTSYTECFPMVLLESLSVGLSVISYDCPTGPKHILTNEDDSYLVPYKNLDIFTEKLKLLISDPQLRKKMGIKGIKNVNRFNIDKVMQQWKELLTSLQ